MDIYTSKINELKRKIAEIEDENDMDDIRRKSNQHKNKTYRRSKKKKKTKSTTTTTTTTNNDEDENRKAYNLNNRYMTYKSQLKACETNLLLLEEILESDVSSESEDEESSDDSQSSASSRSTISDTGGSIYFIL